MLENFHAVYTNETAHGRVKLGGVAVLSDSCNLEGWVSFIE